MTYQEKKEKADSPALKITSMNRYNDKKTTRKSVEVDLLQPPETIAIKKKTSTEQK